MEIRKQFYLYFEKVIEHELKLVRNEFSLKTLNDWNNFKKNIQTLYNDFSGAINALNEDAIDSIAVTNRLKYMERLINCIKELESHFNNQAIENHLPKIMQNLATLCEYNYKKSGLREILEQNEFDNDFKKKNPNEKVVEVEDNYGHTFRIRGIYQEEFTTLVKELKELRPNYNIAAAFISGTSTSSQAIANSKNIETSERKIEAHEQNMLAGNIKLTNKKDWDLFKTEVLTLATEYTTTLAKLTTAKIVWARDDLQYYISLLSKIVTTMEGKYKEEDIEIYLPVIEKNIKTLCFWNYCTTQMYEMIKRTKMAKLDSSETCIIGGYEVALRYKARFEELLMKQKQLQVQFEEAIQFVFGDKKELEKFEKSIKNYSGSKR